MKKIIILYNFTDYMAQPWLDDGYEVWCFDGQHKSGITRDGNHIKVGMWFDAYTTGQHVKDIMNMVGKGVELVLGFPECTDLANSGSRHFERKLRENPACQAEATELARMVMYLGQSLNVPWALENPVGLLNTIWRKPNFYFHPYEYGCYLPEDDVHPDFPDYILPRDAYTKKTGIFSGNGFIEPVRRPIKRELVNRDSKCAKRSDNKDAAGYSAQYERLGGNSSKTKLIRSATPRGFSLSVFASNARRGSSRLIVP